MSNSRAPSDSLAKLREDLKHFDKSGRVADDPNVVEIKSTLLRTHRGTRSGLATHR